MFQHYFVFILINFHLERCIADMLVSPIFSFMQIGKISREGNLVRDIYQIETIVPKNTTVTVPGEMYYDNDFVMPGFLMRYYHISISPYKQYKYLLIFKEYTPPGGPKHFQKILLETTRLDLYEYRP